jgi:hypothetical protein
MEKSHKGTMKKKIKVKIPQKRWREESRKGARE